VLLSRWGRKLNKNIRVCFLSSEFIPIYGGVGAYTTELLRHLPEEIDLHLITVRREIQGMRGKECYSEEGVFRRNFNIHYVSSGHDTFFFYFLFQRACLKKLLSLHKKYEFDLLHTQFPVMPDLLVQFFRKTGIPTVCTVHSTVETQLTSIKRTEGGFFELDRAEKANLLLFFPLKICQYFYLKGIEWFITVSEFVRRKLVESYGFLNEKRIITIHHGVDTELYSPRVIQNDPPLIEESSRPIVLFTGRFVAKKGPHVLIRAIPKVLECAPDAYFVFAGGGDFAPYMRLIKHTKISEESYRYLGYVRSSEMPRLYSLASVYVAPSFEDSLGIRILEAMSCGKAVVASEVGGVPEIVHSGQNGLLSTLGDVDELAEKITMLLEDDALRKRLGEAGRQTVLDRFSVTTMARQTARLYDRILQLNSSR
jgi:glycosyltransferase involved in cell wall biosynthesis